MKNELFSCKLVIPTCELEVRRSYKELCGSLGYRRSLKMASKNCQKHQKECKKVGIKNQSKIDSFCALVIATGKLEVLSSYGQI